MLKHGVKLGVGVGVGWGTFPVFLQERVQGSVWPSVRGGWACEYLGMF